ncbi:MAG: hypothetical protein WEC83_00525 [Patescibacteria group bacterium]
MNKHTHKLGLLKCPWVRGEKQTAPRYDNIPRLRFHGLTHPEYNAYEAQLDFDQRVFRALIIGGVGEEQIPKDGDDMLMLLTGAVCIVGLGKGIDPKSVYLQDNFTAVFGQWELAWPALEAAGDKICPSIRQSLERLLVPSCEPAQNDADDSSSYCMATHQFWDGPYGDWYCWNYYSAWGTGSLLRLQHHALKDGIGLETFSAKEQRSLGLLIEGVKTMQPLVEQTLTR